MSPNVNYPMCVPPLEALSKRLVSCVTRRVKLACAHETAQETTSRDGLYKALTIAYACG